MPRYHLFPTSPQILHQLVLELFVRTPAYEKTTENFFSIVPSGPIYRYGGVLANYRKQIFHSHPDYETLVIISFADLAPDVSGITTSDEKLHTFFGTIMVEKEIA